MHQPRLSKVKVSLTDPYIPPLLCCHLRSTEAGEQYLAWRAVARSAGTIKLYIEAHKRARKLPVKIKICRKTLSTDELRPSRILRGPPLHYLPRHLRRLSFFPIIFTVSVQSCFFNSFNLLFFYNYTFIKIDTNWIFL